MRPWRPFLTDGTVPSAEVLRRALRKGTVNSAFTVVLCGSSYKNKGVQQVLDAVVDYMPARRTLLRSKRSTADGAPIGERKCSDDEPSRPWLSKSSMTPMAR